MRNFSQTSYAANVNFVPRQNDAEQLTEHRVFDCLLSFLENKRIKFRGQVLPFVLSPRTIGGLSPSEIDEAEKSILRTAEQMRDCEILHDAPASLFYECEKRNETSLIFDNRIVPVPGLILNALICGELLKRFSEADLHLCGCFVKVRDFGIDGEICESWRLDIDSRYARRGFFVPCLGANGMIKDLRVFRHPKDFYPFILRSRAGFMDLTRGEQHYG